MQTAAERATDLEVRDVEFVVALSQVCLKSLFALVHMDTLDLLLLQLGSEVVSFFA